MNEKYLINLIYLNMKINKMLSYSKKGIHLYGSKQGFTSRTIAETQIECRAMGL
jgi:hypothetical protein